MAPRNAYHHYDAAIYQSLWVLDRQGADDAVVNGTLDALPVLAVLSITQPHVPHPAGADGEGEGDGDADDDDAELQASLDEQQQASLEAYGKDIKELDEVFEVIAKVGRGLGQSAGTWCLNKLRVQLPAWLRHVAMCITEALVGPHCHTVRSSG